MGKDFVLISFKYGVSSEFTVQFPLRYFYIHYFFLLPHAKYEKNPTDIPVSLFFLNINIIWPEICSKDHTHFTFFGVFLLKLEKSININNLCCHLVALKKSW